MPLFLTLVLAVQIDAGGILVCMNNIELKPTSHISTGKSALGYESCPCVNVNYYSHCHLNWKCNNSISFIPISSDEEPAMVARRHLKKSAVK